MNRIAFPLAAAAVSLMVGGFLLNSVPGAKAAGTSSTQVTNLVVDQVTNSSARLRWSDPKDSTIYSIRYMHTLMAPDKFVNAFEAAYFTATPLYVEKDHPQVFTVRCLPADTDHYIAVLSVSGSSAFVSNVVKFRTGPNGAATTLNYGFRVSNAGILSPSAEEYARIGRSEEDQLPKIVWDNPIGSNWSKVVLIRKEGEAALTPDMPSGSATIKKVYEGRNNSYTDQTVEDSRSYFYSIFLYDLTGRPGDPNVLQFDTKTGPEQGSTGLAGETAVSTGGSNTSAQGAAGESGGSGGEGAGVIEDVYCPNLYSAASGATSVGTTVGSGGEIALDTAGGAVVNRFSGTLIKYSGDQTIYLLENGKKRPITSYDIYQTYYQSRPLITVPPNESYTTGVAVAYKSGAVIKTTSDPAVYVILNDGTKYAFKSEFEFYQNGYDWSSIHWVSAQELANYTISNTGRLSYYPTNTYIQSPDSGLVSMVSGQGRVRPISDYRVWLANGNLRGTVFNGLNNLFSQGSILTIPDGTLIKAEGGATVYMIDGARRRAFSSEAAFKKYGFSFSSVISVPSGVVNLHAEGAAIQ